MVASVARRCGFALQSNGRLMRPILLIQPAATRSHHGADEQNCPRRHRDFLSGTKRASARPHLTVKKSKDGHTARDVMRYSEAALLAGGVAARPATQTS